MDELIRSVEGKRSEAVPDLNAGDIVSVHVRIKEGARERVQEFKGTVIASGGKGNNKNFERPARKRQTGHNKLASPEEQSATRRSGRRA